MKIYPKKLELLIEYLKKLPGVGTKTAERYSMALINFYNEELDNLAEIISSLKQELRYCKICGHLTDADICHICSNTARNKKVIMVVEDFRNIFMFEKTQRFDGVYHVLGGLISPIDGINPDDLNISKLLERCKDASDIEIITAFKPTIEGEMTSLYLKKVLEKTGNKVSRLSYGIPIGTDFDYLDTITLERALIDRKEIT